MRICRKRVSVSRMITPCMVYKKGLMRGQRETESPCSLYRDAICLVSIQNLLRLTPSHMTKSIGVQDVRGLDQNTVEKPTT